MTVKEILYHCPEVRFMYVPKDSSNLEFFCIYPDEFESWFEFVPNNWRVSTDQFGDMYLSFDY